MKTKRSFTEKLPLILAFVLPILIMLGIFAGKDIWPFGDNCFLRTDLYHQYVAFFEDLGDRLREGKSLLYAFDIGLGSNYPALFAYYLCSPMHLLAFLVPTEYVIEFITYLIVLKIGLCGWAMAWYLSRRFNTRHIGITICGVCYALSGYLAAYSWNIMWLDVLWLSVLAIYGLEKLMKENNPFPYCITLALCILCNYYISIMLCIFMVLYFINRLIALPKMSGRQLLARFGNFAFFSLLAGAMAAVLVVPAAYALMGTASANTTFPKTLSNYFSIVEMLSRHLVVVDVEIGLDHWPNIYSGVLVLLLVPLYYMNKKVPFREKIANTLLLGFMLLSFNTNMLNYIWHGLHYPNSLPCRQSFLYTFIIMVMCFEGIRHIRAVSKETIVRIMWCAIGVILLVELIADSEEIPYYACYASIAFLALYTLFIYLRKAGKIDRHTSAALIICVLIIEMGLNTAVTSVSYVRRSDFMRYNDSFDELVAIAEKDRPFTRIERQFFIYTNAARTKNDGVYLGYNSASIFSSTTNAAISEFYKKVGLEGNTNAYSITGATPFMWAFLNLEYRITDTRLPNSPLYELIESARDRKNGYDYLYHNTYTMPLGYLIPPDVNKLWVLNATAPVRSQNSFVNLSTGVGNIFDSVSSNVKDAVLTATIKDEGYYCVHVTSSSVKKVTATVNGSNSHVWDSINRNYLAEFGWLQEGDEIKLTAADVKTMSAVLYKLNLENFAAAMEVFNSHPFTITEFTDRTFKTEIRGTVDADKESMLVWSIPIENGWKVKVDGKDTEVTPLADSFVAVNVGPGHHDIVLSYIPEGLPTGILLSAGGLAIYLIALAVYLIFRATRKNRPEEIPGPKAPEAILPEDESAEAGSLLSDGEAPDSGAQTGKEEGTKEIPAARKALTGRERIAALHQFDEEERLRDRGFLPVVAFEGGSAYPRYVSPAERQADEKLLSLGDPAAPAQAEASVQAEAPAQTETPAPAEELSSTVARLLAEAPEPASASEEVPAEDTVSGPEPLDAVPAGAADTQTDPAAETPSAVQDEAYLKELEDLLRRTESSLAELSEKYRS